MAASLVLALLLPLLQPRLALAEPTAQSDPIADSTISFYNDHAGQPTMAITIPGLTSAEVKEVVALLPVYHSENDPFRAEEQGLSSFYAEAQKIGVTLPSYSEGDPEPNGIDFWTTANKNGSTTFSLTTYGPQGWVNWRTIVTAFVGAATYILGGAACVSLATVSFPPLLGGCPGIAGGISGAIVSMFGLILNGSSFDWNTLLTVAGAAVVSGALGVPGAAGSVVSNKIVSFLATKLLPKIIDGSARAFAAAGISNAVSKAAVSAIGYMASLFGFAFAARAYKSGLPSAQTTAQIQAPGGKCVDVEGNDNGANGAHIQLWDCLLTAKDQEWYHTADGQLHTAIGRCMGVSGDGTANFTKVQLWDCNGAPGEVWRQQPNGSLVNPHSGRCLDDPEGQHTDGLQLQIYDCNGYGSQHFDVVGRGPIAANGGKCVDVNGDDDGSNGSAIQLWDCLNTAVDQHWTHTPDGQLHTIGRCMGVSGDGTANNTKIQLWDCKAAPGEIWQVQNGNLYNPHSGKCLDDPQGLTTNGIRLQIYTCIGSAAQHFIVN